MAVFVFRLKAAIYPSFYSGWGGAVIRDTGGPNSSVSLPTVCLTEGLWMRALTHHLSPLTQQMLKCPQ